MSAFPTVADCVRLVDFGSQEPQGVQFDAALSLIYGTGCLVSEISGLRRSDVQRTAAETKVLLGAGGEGRLSARTVTLSGKVKAAIDRHIENVRDGSEVTLFRSTRGGALNGASLNSELLRRGRVLGFAQPLTAGELRRACVRHCLERGMRPEQLAPLLGLSDVNSVLALGR